MHALEFYRPTWPVNDNVLCLSTTILGGHSANEFNSLNLGAHVGDNAEAVEQNRVILACELSNLADTPSPITWLNQTHSNAIVTLDQALSPAEVQADAAFTTKHQLPCTVMTADCMAIMIANTKGTEIAAVHAGWKGLANGIIENAIAKFTSPREEICIWFAPSICQKHFEVGQDLADLFASYPSALVASPNKGKYLLDLTQIAREKLLTLGVTQQYSSNICTYSSSNLFSHRRATHQGLTSCGRMANLILIKNLHN